MAPLTHWMSSSHPTSIALLVSRVRAGHADAIGELYARVAGRLGTLARRLTGSRQDAEDVVHDVFLGLPEALRHYDERGQLDAWLRRVTARVALTRVRSRQRLRELGLEAELPQPHAALSLDDTLALSAAVDSLPDSLRTVIVLKMIEGYSHEEIGVLLGITPRASEQRLHRAVKILRSQFTSSSSR
jgi:RNA polymerase sigma-70 factor (ECF subfamily)